LIWVKAGGRARAQPLTMTFPEFLHDIAHLGSVELLTPQPEKSLWYFRDLLGMEVVHRTDGAAWLRGYGDHAASTLKLSAAPAAGVGCIAWRAESPAALDRRAAALEQAGLGIGWTNGDFGRGRSFRFRDPDGHLMEVYYEEQRYRAPPALRSALKNQPQRYPGQGVGVRRTDHLALLAADVAANRRFAQELLGFRLREQVVFDEGRSEIGSWMSPNAIHHQLAYVADVKGGHGRLHHFSLWVDNREDVLRAADILTENGIFIEAGPAKHNNSQGFYLYSYEPGGNRVEIYSGSYLVLAPDWQPVTWNERERGTGTYWGGALPDSFIQYGTPDIGGDGAAPPTRLPVFY
jgi:catechol 2,3-dioxygenase